MPSSFVRMPQKLRLIASRSFCGLPVPTSRPADDPLLLPPRRLPVPQPSWDYLANTQLDALEARGVPGLGVSKAERESDLGSNRLRKILGMLEGVLEDS